MIMYSCVHVWICKFILWVIEPSAETLRVVDTSIDLVEGALVELGSVQDKWLANGVTIDCSGRP